jgi:hypothetical protein
MSNVRIEVWLDRYAHEPRVREYLSGLLHMLAAAAARKAPAATRSWRCVCAAMDAPVRDAQDGEERFEQLLDKFLPVLALAEQWNMRHSHTEGWPH